MVRYLTMIFPYPLSLTGVVLGIPGGLLIHPFVFYKSVLLLTFFGAHVIARLTRASCLWVKMDYDHSAY